MLTCGYLCVAVYVTGGFRLKYAASHISEALDNADWRGRKDEEFRRSRFHGDGSSPATVCEQRAEALSTLGKEKQKHSQKESDLPRARWTKPKYLCLRKTCSHGDDSPCGAQQQSTWLPASSLSLSFWYFCTEVWKWLTYYLIRMFSEFGEIFGFYMKWAQVSREKDS